MARILVVDDEDDPRELLREILARANHDVVVASGASEALATYRAQRPDLVIADLLLPDGAGLSLLLQLTRDYGARVIVVSGGGTRGRVDLLESAEECGAWRTLPKPVRRQELLAAVNEALGVT